VQTNFSADLPIAHSLRSAQNYTGSLRFMASARARIDPLLQLSTLLFAQLNHLRLGPAPEFSKLCQ
jgi:hypothetical protein